MTGAVVYRMFDAAGRLLYVGATCRGARRFVEHHGQPWWPKVTTVTVEHFADRQAAFDAEAHALATEAPAHNMLGVPHRTCGEQTRRGSPCRAVTEGGPCPDHGGLARFEQRTRLAELLRPARAAVLDGGNG